MINLVVKKKAPKPKLNIVQLRLDDELFKKIKSSLPKDKSVSMHALLVSVLETTFASGNIKVKVQEGNYDKRGGNSRD